MSKSPDAFRTISEVAEWLDTPAHVLRFWESRFSQIKPVKRAGGRRYYRPSDMALLGGIKKLLHEDGMTIRGVQKLLRERGVKYVAGLSQPVDGEQPPKDENRDTVVPAAPMAENVPQDMFDAVEAEPEPTVVPFPPPKTVADSAASSEQSTFNFQDDQSGAADIEPDDSPEDWPITAPEGYDEAPAQVDELGDVPPGIAAFIASRKLEGFSEELRTEVILCLKELRARLVGAH